MSGQNGTMMLVQRLQRPAGLFTRGISSAPALLTPPVHRHARSESRALAQGMLRDGMPAGAQWHLGEALWWRLDSCLLAKHDTPVAEEDVRHQGEWSAWLILLEPAVVPFSDASPVFEFVVREFSIERKWLRYEQWQVTARLDSLVDCRPHGVDGERLSEIALGIDASGADRPAWPQPCGHGTDSTDAVLDRAVVSDVDAAAWVADGRLKAKPESLGLADGGGHRSEEEDQGSNRNGNGADDRGPVGNCIQHDHPVRLGECRPAVALVGLHEVSPPLASLASSRSSGLV